MATQNIDKTAIIQAVLAEDVYVDKDEKGEWTKHRHRYQGEDGKWYVDVILPGKDGADTKVTLEVVKDVDNPENGFQGSIYRNSKTGELYGAIRGTEFARETFQDGVKADFMGMGAARINTQMASARAFGNELLKMAAEDGKRYGTNPKVYLTGHSLAGAIAQYLAHYYGDRITRTDTFNAYGSASLGYGQQTPNQPAPNVYNYRMAGDSFVSGLSNHYGQVITFDAPTVEGSAHGISNFTYRGKDAKTQDETFVLGNPEYYQQYAKEHHKVHMGAAIVKALRVAITYANPVHLADFLWSKMHGLPKAGERATHDGVPPYQPGAAVMPERHRPQMNQQDTQTNNAPKQTEQKQLFPVHTQPQLANDQKFMEQFPKPVQKMLAQGEEKLLAYCAKNNITSSHPEQDVKNSVCALVAAAYQKGMTSIEEIGFNDKGMIYAVSHEPHLKFASLQLSEAVNQPVRESLAQIQQTEQVFAQQKEQKEQEKQMSQSQSRGIHLS